MNVFAYWISDKSLLRMYSAQEVTPDNTEFRSYYNMVNELLQIAELAMPKAFMINAQQPHFC